MFIKLKKIFIGNCLLLRGDITIHTHLTVVTYEHLVSLIGDLILKSLPNNASDEVRLNHQQNLGDAISIMQKLQTGLDVNVGFSRFSFFLFFPFFSFFLLSFLTFFSKNKMK